MHRLHVDLVEGREDRVGRLRLKQPLGHARAQPRHRHALLGRPSSSLAPSMGALTWGSDGPATGRSAEAWRRVPPQRAATADSTSPLVTRPSRPVPAT
jgi:hypothetical protein